MKKQELSKQDIFRLGDKVLNAVRLSEEEVDRIVTLPRLFDPIRSAIESGDFTEPKGSWPVLRVLGWKTVVATLGVFIFLAAAVGFSDLIWQDHPLPIARTLTDITTADVPSPTAPASDPGEPESYAIAKAGQSRRKAIAIQRTRSKSTNRSAPAESEKLTEFYSITYAGDLREAEENGQLVRVELPRESLFAMGITIPTENVADKIKTDLLLGQDGIVRAIRLVN